MAYCKITTTPFVFYLISFLFLTKYVAPREISNYTENVVPRGIAGVVHEHNGEEEIPNNGSDVRRSLRENASSREISNHNKLFALQEIIGAVDHDHHEEKIVSRGIISIRRSLEQHTSPGSWIYASPPAPSGG